MRTKLALEQLNLFIVAKLDVLSDVVSSVDLASPLALVVLTTFVLLVVQRLGFDHRRR